MTNTKRDSQHKSRACGDSRHSATVSGYTGWLAMALLILLGLSYLANGVATLVAPNFAGDLTTRWRERSYLSAGVDPYDVSVQFKSLKPSLAEMTRVGEHNLQNEPAIDPSGYPPWGFAALFLFIPPSPMPFVQVWFAAICLLALGLTIWNAFVLGRQWGTRSGLLMAAAVFAMFGNASTLRLGQYGLILNAFLVITVWGYSKGQALGSGLAMAMAAIKPNYSILQVAAMVPGRQWVSLILVAVICAAASLVPWVLTGVNPIEMTEQMLRQSEFVTDADTSLLRLARSMMPYPQAVTGLALVGLAATLVLGWNYRNSSPLVVTSIAAVMGRLCFYHRQYDNVMLMFPLLTLGLVSLTTGKKWAWVVFIIYGTTLWVPIPYSAYNSFVILALSAVWFAGLLVICRCSDLLPTSQGPKNI